jgi:exodeoxyribonuclease V alpha subunit
MRCMENLTQEIFRKNFAEFKAEDRSFIDSLLALNILPYIDYALARHLLKNMSEASEALLCFLCHLSLASRNGHLCIYIEKDKILPCPKQLWLKPSDSVFEIDYEALNALIIQGAARFPFLSNLDRFDASYPFHSVYKEGNRFYFQKYWIYETQFLRAFTAFKNSPLTLKCDLESVFSRVEALIAEKKLLKEQGEAIIKASRNTLTLICGGPGTGKTYTAAYILKILWETLSEEQKQQCEIVLAAPTGKAASNLQNSLARILNTIEGLKPIVAQTLHSLLGVKVQANQFKNPSYLSADIIIVDESSMIDIKLMVNLLTSIKPGARLILLGDKNQLPPVESGGLFADMIQTLENGDITSKPVIFQACLRTDLKDILDVAKAVNYGDRNQVFNTLLDLNQTSSSVKVSYLSSNIKENLKEIIEYVSPFYEYSDSNGEGEEKLLEKFNQFRLLSSLRRGPFGVDELNMQIKNYFIKKYRHRPRFLIPIMILNNDPKLGLFNGEAGLLVKTQPIDAEQWQKGDFAIFPDSPPNHYKRFPAVLLPKFEYAYCLSVHKSQGSEFDHVVLLLLDGSEMFGREVLYTAITRARKKIEIYTKEGILHQTVERSNLRLSGIQERYKSSERLQFDNLFKNSFYVR